MCGQDDTCCSPPKAVVSTGVKKRRALSRHPGVATKLVCETECKHHFGYHQLDCDTVVDVHEEEASNVLHRDPNVA